jgi:hypothetical protein
MPRASRRMATGDARASSFETRRFATLLRMRFGMRLCRYPNLIPKKFRARLGDPRAVNLRRLNRNAVSV